MNRIDTAPLRSQAQAQSDAAAKFATDAAAAEHVAELDAKALDPAAQAKIYADRAGRFLGMVDAIQDEIIKLGGDPTNLVAPLLAQAGDDSAAAQNFLAQATAVSTDTPAAPPIG